jgi:nucleoside-diphosphate-sugar epimerase
MPEILFITGSRGFVGKPLVSRLLATGLWQIRVLVRPPRKQDDDLARGLDFVVGDLCDEETYKFGLEGVYTVIHLAALTGKAAPPEYERANFEGTKILLQACKRTGVRRFLYVSTIAATYPDQRYFTYAQTKARAEALVRESGIPYSIIRPTAVIGSGSPIWRTLSSLAKLPVVPLPNGGRVKLQPIDVDDLVQGIELVVSEGRFEGEALDLGGPSPISFADFMCTIHQAYYGKEPRVISFPLAPLRNLLGFVEPVLRLILPVTAGQLALFANDSTASPNWLHDRLKERMRTVKETIATLASGQNSFYNRATAESSTAIAPCDFAAIVRECDVFTRYLVGQPPTDYVHKQYKMAVLARDLANSAEFRDFDRRTLSLARRNAFFTRVADAYCAIFHRHGVLRRKLILLLAILEHTPPTAARFDSPKNIGSIGIATNLFLLGISFGLLLLAAIFLLLPSHIYSRTGARRPLEGGEK